MATSRKPRPLDLTRNADAEAHPQLGKPEHAECDQGGCDMEGSGRYECGRTVRVPCVVFDESDGKKIRKLAEWLQAAAAWVEGGR
jgi:hypothetical protein